MSVKERWKERRIFRLLSRKERGCGSLERSIDESLVAKEAIERTVLRILTSNSTDCSEGSMMIE